jgi:hypothetical protein
LVFVYIAVFLMKSVKHKEQNLKVYLFVDGGSI